MQHLKRITMNPAVMGGKPCIRGMRVTVGMVVGLLASGHSEEEILKLYPYLEVEDLREALAYAAWRAEEVEVSGATEHGRPVAQLVPPLAAEVGQGGFGCMAGTFKEVGDIVEPTSLIGT